MDLWAACQQLVVRGPNRLTNQVSVVAPQGGVTSPILSNIYLDKLDQFVEQELIPAWTRGKSRKKDPRYSALAYEIRKQRRKGDRYTVKALLRRQHLIPSVDVKDPGFRRLRYCRYADDHILGFIGSKAEAEQIKDELARFLREELKLTLSPDKTLITHARSQRARFLGYDIHTQRSDTKLTRGKRSVNGVIALSVPKQIVEAKCRQYQYRQRKPLIKRDLVTTTDHHIIGTFGGEYRGFVQYYLLAGDVNRLDKLRYYMEGSMFSTLAKKHRCPPWVMRRRFETTCETPHGKRRCFEATHTTPNGTVFTARFGGIPLRRRPDAKITDGIWPTRRGKQLIARLIAGTCELCGAGNAITVHHVARMHDLARYPLKGPPDWVQHMRRHRRKTIIVCADCHATIHQAPDTQQRPTGEPDARKQARPVRGAAERKRTHTGTAPLG